jgi:hypothetical protein
MRQAREAGWSGLEAIWGRMDSVEVIDVGSAKGGKVSTAAGGKAEYDLRSP